MAWARPEAILALRNMEISISQWTDRQISDLLYIYGDVRQLSEHCRAVWKIIENDLDAFCSVFVDSLVESGIIEANFKGIERQQYIEYYRFVFNEPIDAAWFTFVSKSGYQIVDGPYTLEVIIAIFSKVVDKVSEIISRSEMRVQLIPYLAAVNRLYSLQTAVVTIEVRFIENQRARELRVAKAHEFDERIAGRIGKLLETSGNMREKTVSVDLFMKHLGGSALEITSAAKQSADAMQNAATTTSGLVGAIDGTMQELMRASATVSRVAVQTDEAAALSDSLREHAHKIGSIVQLIRQTAHRTNLLALNAAIEAARAGDTGRGFAVVAKEVKALAGQTTGAIDEVTAQIAAIQQAAFQSAAASTAIRETVLDVRMTTERVHKAMQDQSQTVTVITAAVDETALAASSMAGSIAFIQNQFEKIESDIQALSTDIADVYVELGDLGNEAREFSGSGLSG